MSTTGTPNGIVEVGPHNVTLGQANTQMSINAAAPIGPFRVATIWIANASANVTPPPGWATVLDTGAFGAMRMGVYWTLWDTNDTTTQSTWTWDTSALAGTVCNSWTGVDPNDPFLLAPNTDTCGGATSGTTLAVPGFAPPDGTGMGLWFWAIKPTSSASSSTITLPSDLTSCGNIVTTASSGYRCRAGAYADANLNGQQTPTQIPGHTATGSRSAPWAGVGMAMRPDGSAARRFLPFFRNYAPA